MTYFDKLAYEKYYIFQGERHGRVNTRPGIKLHYNHYICGETQKEDALKIINLLDLDDTCKCVLIGAGFNWTGEGFMEQGIETVGTEISEWVLSEKDNTEEADLREYISKTGLDPDRDEIIGKQYDPRCKFYVPEYKQNDWDKWIVSEAAEKRRKEVAEWQTKTEEEKRVICINTSDNDYNPIMPTASKPEFMINPLEQFLNGGRSAPQPRTSGILIGEGVDTTQSRSTVRGQLNDSPTHIISEQVLNSLNDEEGLVLCDNLAKMAVDHGGMVYHIFSPLDDSADQREELNWKTYKDWRLHLDKHNFENQKIIPSDSYKDLI